MEILQGDAPTRERVARSILENGPSTAADLAARLSLTPAAVRRHLDHLVAVGTVEARERRVYGVRGRGRPAKVFALTEIGRDSFDQHYDDLAVAALRFLAETGGDVAVMEFARRRVAFIERDCERLLAEQPELTPAEALTQVLTAGGYAATLRELPVVGEQLCQQHCPVSHVAHEFPQLCEAETEAIGRVVGTHVQRLATIAHGDGVCTTCIPGLDTPALVPRAGTRPPTEAPALVPRAGTRPPTEAPALVPRAGTRPATDAPALVPRPLNVQEQGKEKQ